MATVIETVERDGRSIRVYDNGMERDADTGRIVKPPPHTIIADSERATELHRRRQELKRERILAGAARTLERGGEWSTPDDLDVVEALGEAVMMKALNPDNAKQVDAARFILQEAGLSASQERGDQDPQQPGNTQLILLLAELTQRDDGNVIEGRLVTERDISVSNNQGESSHNLDTKETDESVP